MYAYYRYIGDEQVLKNVSPGPEFEDQVEEKKSEHKDDGQEGRVEGDALGQIPFQQGNKCSLQAATRTPEAGMFPEGTGLHS